MKRLLSGTFYRFDLWNETSSNYRVSNNLEPNSEEVREKEHYSCIIG